MVYKQYHLYEQDPALGNGYRAAYLESVKGYLSSLEQDSAARRDKYMESFSKETLETYREAYKAMLGTPLTGDPSKSGYTVSETVMGEDDLCLYRRVTLKISLPDSPAVIDFYGILALPHGAKGTMPTVLLQHGGGGTPELCMDMNGKNNYTHIAKVLAEEGFAVFAPQLMLWAFRNNAVTGPNYENPYDRRVLDNQLKHHGSSITALEIYCLMKTVDYLLTQEFADPNRLCMIGLSYGGFYTLYTMAADPRIRVGYSCAAFNDKLNGSPTFFDWKWKNSAHTYFDAETAALCIPRHLLVDVGKADPVFPYAPSLSEASRAEAYFPRCGCADRFSFNLWEGGHRIDMQGKNLKRFVSLLKD